ncbi:MAG TPA: rRNA maturation RNase YbeY [Rubrivivax sp.]|nr:rRNA maturation RNase YbeY [Pseudomonadota bacterium]HRY90535.1 rRNA maturation RNase YbeY [Rubrivivax sp.]HRZ63173.1 rRNA maturation RNase YbeY [Rubrivivax sp.]
MAARTEPVAPPRPALQLSLQQPDARHRAWLPRRRVARWLRAALEAPAELTVRIVGEAEGRALNRDFRGRDYATNVLTFDYARAPLVQADLVLCAPVVEREAHAAGRPLDAHYAHLLVHGALHAQGWDHETSAADARRMEARERALLAALGFADPYAPAPRSRRAASSAK